MLPIYGCISNLQMFLNVVIIVFCALLEIIANLIIGHKMTRTFRARLFGIFRNKNIFRLFCSWEQNSRNGNSGIQVFRNTSQTNANSHKYKFTWLITVDFLLIVNSYASVHITHQV